MKKLLLSLSILFTLVLAVSFASAEANITYNKVYYGIIEPSGSITGSTTPITGFSTMGYVCTSVNCTTIDDSATIPELTRTTATSEIMLTYPTNLSGFGYVVYFYKDGYIGWEQRNINYAGTGALNESRTIYFSKKRTGFAPISSLSVVNEQAIYMPLEINVTTGIDANTSAALQNVSRYGFGLLEAPVNTTILLTITNSSGGIVNQSTQNILIPISGSSTVSFDYNFTQTGTYTVSVSTNVTDVRILNSVVQTVSSQTNVIQSGLTNYTYTLIQNLAADPVHPDVNETVRFSFDYLSNYVDSFGSLIPVNTSLYFNITRNNVLIDSFYVLANAGSNTSYASYSFQTSFNQSGNYALTVFGLANSTLGNYTIPSMQILPFVIGEVNSTINNTGHIEEHNNHDDDNEEDDAQVLRVLASTKKGSAVNSTVIDLTSKKASSYGILFWFFLILVVLMIVMILLVLIFKFGLFS